MTLGHLAAWLFAINAVGFAAMGFDKIRAASGQRRISERTLVLPVVFGGLPGVLAGRALFRHKTRKASFIEQMWASAVLHVLLVGTIVYLGWFHDPALPG